MEHHSAIAELVLGLCILLLLASATLALAKRMHLPFTILLVIVGLGITALSPVLPVSLARMLAFHISPDIILYVFLPSLIFESALHLDARQLRENLLPVLTLAVPGLLISTVVIAGLVAALTDVPFIAALVLGAILSATDPVAVIALFRQLGAPQRLTVLVEGESLFNDATAIVAAKILLAIAIAGFASWETVANGVLEFVFVFIGGVLVGWLMALAAGFILGAVYENQAIEISILTVLAYLSFIVGEEIFHVSGVMATVAAGLTIGGWGRSKLSPGISDYIEHFWAYISFVANALIFLLVGLTIDLEALALFADVLLIAIFAMLISRALVIYSLVPALGRLPGAEAVSRSYQTVMYWGGLRGAVAIAVVLSLGDFEWTRAFTAVVMGAVLFTLIVQGLTMEPLMRWLGLDIPSAGDRFARDEAMVESSLRAVDRIPELGAGGLFSARIARDLEIQHREEITQLRAAIAELRVHELDETEELRVLHLRCLANEKAAYYEQFARHHITEDAYRAAAHAVSAMIDELRHYGHLPSDTSISETIEKTSLFQRLATHLPKALARHMSTRAVTRAYQIAWAEFQACRRVEEFLIEAGEAQTLSGQAVNKLREHYTVRRNDARKRLDDWAEQFPEFVAAMQMRLAERLILRVERDAIEAHVDTGALPHGLGEELLEQFDLRIRNLGRVTVAALDVDPSELLKKVPFFADAPTADVAQIVARLKPVTVAPGDDVIRQGETGATMYFIARGVMRVLRRDDGGEDHELATLFAGDFFGEIAILEDEPRTATCRAATACALYELSRSEVQEAVALCPGIGEGLRRAAEQRRAE